jgi:predicted nucleic acid-binding protein
LLDELKSIALVGYRQVTDAYLIGLARLHEGRIATLDRAMPALASAKPGEASTVELIE